MESIRRLLQWSRKDRVVSEPGEDGGGRRRRRGLRDVGDRISRIWMQGRGRRKRVHSLEGPPR